MADPHGNFIWYELMTSDSSAARDFYEKLLGWTSTDIGQADMDYHRFSAQDAGIGGVMTITPEMSSKGARPCWMGYLAVDDVDKAAAAIQSAGGAVHMQPWDIPHVGRIAFVADPQGAMFYILQTSHDDTSTAFAATEPKLGHCAWNELASGDANGAVDFYTEHFGWKQKDEMDMGPMGKYLFFYHGPNMIGAVMPKPAEMPVSAWTFYFRVADIDEGVAIIKAQGGKTLHPPQDIPGGEFMVNGQDPQGAYFAIIGPRKEA